MNFSFNHQSIKEAVSAKIRSGQVKMKPRIHFVLKAALIVFSAVFVVLFALYVVSFIIFSLRSSGLSSLPGFGFGGWGILFRSLPWFLIFTAVTLIIVSELLVKHFSFAYRRPILYSVLGIIVFVFLGGFIVAETSFHRDLFWRAQEKKLPWAGEFYRGFGAPNFSDIHFGLVIEEIKNGFRLATTEEKELIIIITPDTRLAPGVNIEKGERVIVLGEMAGDNTVQAAAVRQIGEQSDIFRGPRPSRFPLPRH